MVINGSDLFMFMGGTRVAHANSHTLNITMKTRPTTNKDTGKFDTSAVGRLAITASSKNLLVYTDIATMGAAILARQVVALTFGEQTGAVLTDGELVGGTLDSSKFYASGNFIITGLDHNAPEDNADYSVSFENADANFAFHPTGALIAFAFGINCSANAADDGLIAAFPSGGTPPYTYLWDNGATSTTQTVTAQEPGTYTVTVTDDDSTEAEATVTVTEPAP